MLFPVSFLSIRQQDAAAINAKRDSVDICLEDAISIS